MKKKMKETDEDETGEIKWWDDDADCRWPFHHITTSSSSARKLMVSSLFFNFLLALTAASKHYDQWDGPVQKATCCCFQMVRFFLSCDHHPSILPFSMSYHLSSRSSMSIDDQLMIDHFLSFFIISFVILLVFVQMWPSVNSPRYHIHPLFFFMAKRQIHYIFCWLLTRHWFMCQSLEKSLLELVISGRPFGGWLDHWVYRSIASNVSIDSVLSERNSREERAPTSVYFGWKTFVFVS